MAAGSARTAPRQVPTATHKEKNLNIYEPGHQEGELSIPPSSIVASRASCDSRAATGSGVQGRPFLGAPPEFWEAKELVLVPPALGVREERARPPRSHLSLRVQATSPLPSSARSQINSGFIQISQNFPPRRNSRNLFVGTSGKYQLYSAKQVQTLPKKKKREKSACGPKSVSGQSRNLASAKQAGKRPRRSASVDHSSPALRHICLRI